MKTFTTWLFCFGIAITQLNEISKGAQKNEIFMEDGLVVVVVFILAPVVAGVAVGNAIMQEQTQ